MNLHNYIQTALRQQNQSIIPQPSEIDNFARWMKSKDFSIKTIKLYTAEIKKHDLDNLATQTIKEFYRQKIDKMEPNSLIGHRSALKAYAKFKELTIDWEAVNRIIPKVQQKPFPTLGLPELARMKTAALKAGKKFNERNNRLLDFLYFSGMRVSEISNIKHSDYRDNMLKIHGKNNKVRYMPLSPLLVKYLQPDSSDYLFITSYGTLLNKDMIALIVRQKAKAAGINKRITPHTFRRSFATNLDKKGARMSSIQKLLGHAHLNTTARYIHNDYEVIYDDYRKLWEGETVAN